MKKIQPSEIIQKASLIGRSGHVLYVRKGCRSIFIQVENNRMEVEYLGCAIPQIGDKVRIVDYELKRYKVQLVIRDFTTEKT